MLQLLDILCATNYYFLISAHFLSHGAHGFIQRINWRINKEDSLLNFANVALSNSSEKDDRIKPKDEEKIHIPHIKTIKKKLYASSRSDGSNAEETDSTGFQNLRNLLRTVRSPRFEFPGGIDNPETFSSGTSPQAEVFQTPAGGRCFLPFQNQSEGKWESL